MSKIGITCAKRGHLLSIEEIERGHCYKCETMDKGKVPEIATRQDWRLCEKHQRLYWGGLSDCPTCFAEKLGLPIKRPRKMTVGAWIVIGIFLAILTGVIWGLVYGIQLLI
jgi:hypothetical protein